jgi:DnaJ family protein C protein 9
MDDPSSDPINQFFDADELEQPYILYLTLSLLPHAGSSSRSSTAIDGVTSDAIEGITQDDIKKAYRRAALKCHPDKHSHKQDEEKQQMSKEFQKVGFAYAVLSDETRKKRCVALWQRIA